MQLPRPFRKAIAFLLGRGRLAESGGDTPVQTAALPWRCTSDGELEILLITGRSSANWLIPKGWPMLGKSLAEAAAQEAYEEAGVEGRIEADAIGRFKHVKRHTILGTIDVAVLVHPLAVERELGEWPEREERTRRWFPVVEAAGAVSSVELAALIRGFDR